MAAAVDPTVGYFRGAGGTIWPMGLPLPELYGGQLAKGELVRVNEDGSPWTGGTTPVTGGREVAADGRDLEIARLRAQLEELQAEPGPKVDPDAVPVGTVAAVLGWVGDDRDRAARALDAENAAEKPRTTLVAALKALAAEPDPNE